MGVKRRTANPPPAGSSLSLSLEPKPLGETPPTHHKADDVVVDGGGKVKEGQQRPAAGSGGLGLGVVRRRGGRGRHGGGQRLAVAGAGKDGRAGHALAAAAAAAAAGDDKGRDAAVELAGALQRLGVVAAANVLALDEDVGDGALAAHGLERGLHLAALRQLVQLHQHNGHALVGEGRLDLQAKGAERLGEDDDGVVLDQPLRSLRCVCVWGG